MYYTFKPNINSQSTQSMNKKSTIIIDDLKILTQSVSENLWNMAGNSPERPHLIFPEYRDKRVMLGFLTIISCKNKNTI